MANNEYSGKCFCGAVGLQVVGQASAMGYCHCSSCRSWSAGPVNAFTLWKPEEVKITRGADKIKSFHKTEKSIRKWCADCGGHLMTEHPGLGLIDVYAATIPDYPFKPELHINYGEAVLRIRDGLPKLRDVPREMEGSGASMAE